MSEVVPIAQFAAKAVDERVRTCSSSGGVFIALAQSILNQGGVVVGAAWEYGEIPIVKHVIVDSCGGLERLRGSKYVPSSLTGVYAAVSAHLKTGKLVFFSGTPCQTVAMRKMFANAENLVLCAVFCHSVPDAEVWRSYCMDLRRSYGSRIIGVSFKDKEFGWRNSSVVIRFENGQELRETASQNLFMRSMLAGLSTRRSCMGCSFKKMFGHADFFIGDCWGVERVRPEIDDDRGLNAVVVLTSKGLRLLGETNVALYDYKLADIKAYNTVALGLQRILLCKARQERFLMNVKRKGACATMRNELDGCWGKRLLRLGLHLFRNKKF